ncbi:MAG: peptidyl-prolyl cis-trans isomerase [Bacteroidales bacterium]|nr:peptidyl-prolyl cis-trans isomerase [Bacteroidales bacterium]
MYRLLPVITALTIIMSGCSILDGNNHEDPVARVFEGYLYPSDISDAIPAGTSSQDSAVLAKRYVDTWVKDELMLHRAEQALTDEQKDFEKQIAEYRRALLIFSYRQKLLQQKLDTIVRESKVQSYYQENINNFLLGQNVIKGTFIKVPLTAPRIDELRGWSRSNGEDDLDQIEKYCISYADKYSDFNDTWVYFSSIKMQLPMQISQPSSYLRYNRNIETTDSQYRYFLHVSNHLPEGEVAPIEMVSDDITNIILNKRKIEFFQDLEQMVYNDGVTRNQFDIY